MDARCEIARDRGTADQRAGPQEHDLPLGQLAHRVQYAAGELALVRAQLDDDALPFRPGEEKGGIDAGGENAVVAGETLLGGFARRLGERDQRVEPPEQLLALRA